MPAAKRKRRFWEPQRLAVPKKVAKYTPFGRDSSWRDAFGLIETEVSALVALVAAEAAGLPGVTGAQVAELAKKTGHPIGHGYLARLERNGWCVAETDPHSRQKRWRATSRAKRELGLEGWSLLKEVA